MIEMLFSVIKTPSLRDYRIHEHGQYEGKIDCRLASGVPALFHGIHPDVIRAH
jgi:hypothetical protein